MIDGRFSNLPNIPNILVGARGIVEQVNLLPIFQSFVQHNRHDGEITKFEH